MNRKRLIIEMGTGIELHGQEMTKAAVKAVRDAVSRVCFGIGLTETFGLHGHEDITSEVTLDVLIACPRPEEVKMDNILSALPPGQREVRIVPGGMVARGHYDPGIGDKSDEILVANAAITVYVDLDKVNLAEICLP